ncbi:MAG: NADH-quinone oxidoreductase subunit I [Thermoguttaceae bacterium]|nr:NADH-quinone oxidoreductase subunit I [Thermoguttaceae bacterium]MDW8079607.1 NADH-quinone oxidoreductase subunit I [Thermoguttaceae bacterium]
MSQPGTKKIRWVNETPLSPIERTYIPLVVQGLATTIRHLFSKKITVQFPEERYQPPDPIIYRGVHRLNRDEKGRVKCVACFLCSTACPARCIDIEAGESPWPDREKYPVRFTIDMLRCIFCGMCEEACPVNAIELTSLYDLSGKSREEMVFDKNKLLLIYDWTKDAEPPLERLIAAVGTREVPGGQSPPEAPEETWPPADAAAFDRVAERAAEARLSPPGT